MINISFLLVHPKCVKTSQKNPFPNHLNIFTEELLSSADALPKSPVSMGESESSDVTLEEGDVPPLLGAAQVDALSITSSKSAS